MFFSLDTTFLWCYDTLMLIKVFIFLYVSAFLLCPVASLALDVSLIRVVDGDSIRVNLPCDVAVVCHNVPIRVLGVNTPELRGRCSRGGYKAKLHTIEFLSGKITLDGCKKTKFYLGCNVYSDGKSLATDLINKGYGVPYSGGKRKCLK